MGFSRCQPKTSKNYLVENFIGSRQCMILRKMAE